MQSEVPQTVENKNNVRTGILCFRLSNAARKCGSRGLKVRHDSSPQMTRMGTEADHLI